MFAPILKMEGTWHVLSKLDHLILRISNRKKHVAGTRLLRLRRLDVPCDVVLLHGFKSTRVVGTDALVQASTSSVSAQPVVRLAQVDILRLRIPVPESLASNVHVGTSADIAVQATGEHFTGKIARSTGALDRATRT